MAQQGSTGEHGESTSEQRGSMGKHRGSIGGTQGRSTREPKLTAWQPATVAQFIDSNMYLPIDCFKRHLRECCKLVRRLDAARSSSLILNSIIVFVGPGKLALVHTLKIVSWDIGVRMLLNKLIRIKRRYMRARVVAIG